MTALVSFAQDFQHFHLGHRLTALLLSNTKSRECSRDYSSDQVFSRSQWTRVSLAIHGLL